MSENKTDIKKGRPFMYNKEMRRLTVSIPDFMIEWLGQQPDDDAQTIRNLIQRAIDREEAAEK